MLLRIKNINSYPDDFYKEYYQKLNEYTKSKINKLKRIEDKKLSLLGQYLVANELNINPKNIHYLANVPYIINKDIYISITHKYPYVAIAISKNPIGLDLETVRSIDDVTIKYLNCQNSLDALITWTKKESLFKCPKKYENKFKTIIINKEIIITLCT